MTLYVETTSDTAFTVFIATCQAAMRLTPDEWLVSQTDRPKGQNRKAS